MPNYKTNLIAITITVDREHSPRAISFAAVVGKIAENMVPKEYTERFKFRLEKGCFKFFEEVEEILEEYKVEPYNV